MIGATDTHSMAFNVEPLEIFIAAFNNAALFAVSVVNGGFQNRLAKLFRVNSEKLNWLRIKWTQKFWLSLRVRLCCLSNDAMALAKTVP